MFSCIPIEDLSLQSSSKTTLEAPEIRVEQPEGINVEIFLKMTINYKHFIILFVFISFSTINLNIYVYSMYLCVEDELILLTWIFIYFFFLLLDIYVFIIFCGEGSFSNTGHTYWMILINYYYYIKYNF